MVMTEPYKIKNELAPPIMDLVLNNFRNFYEFQSERKRTGLNV